MVEFVIGYDLIEFEKYYKTIWDAIPGREQPYLSTVERKLLVENPSRLIGWRKGHNLIGHAIWHETFTERHREGVPREEDDKKILEELISRGKRCVELHEIWLKVEFRGYGYGKLFFPFFENLMAGKGFEFIIYYTNNEVAIKICRQRGYTESYGVKADPFTWYVFVLKL